MDVTLRQILAKVGFWAKIFAIRTGRVLFGASRKVVFFPETTFSNHNATAPTHSSPLAHSHLLHMDRFIGILGIILILGLAYL
ncbi:MAG TPA: hypothetical protein PKH43_07640, partial [Saprospiraceae bacterium]|nr:hypothetical protein [Saprospiraceae bacterium]